MFNRRKRRLLDEIPVAPLLCVLVLFRITPWYNTHVLFKRIFFFSFFFVSLLISVCFLFVATGRQAEGGPKEEGRRRSRAQQARQRPVAGRPTAEQVVLGQPDVHAVLLAGRHRRGLRRRVAQGKQGVLQTAVQQRGSERFRVRRVVAPQQGVRVQVVERVMNAPLPSPPPTRSPRPHALPFTHPPPPGRVVRFRKRPRPPDDPSSSPVQQRAISFRPKIKTTRPRTFDATPSSPDRLPISPGPLSRTTSTDSSPPARDTIRYHDNDFQRYLPPSLLLYVYFVCVYTLILLSPGLFV